jgi:hypothetical protein
MPNIVPVLAKAIWDTKADVKKAARNSLMKATVLVSNKVIEHFIPAPLIKALLLARAWVIEAGLHCQRRKVSAFYILHFDHLTHLNGSVYQQHVASPAQPGLSRSANKPNSNHHLASTSSSKPNGNHFLANLGSSSHNHPHHDSNRNGISTN